MVSSCFVKFVNLRWVPTDRRFIVTQHLKTEKHKLAEIRRQEQMKNKSQQLVCSAITSKKGIFNYNLCDTLLSANIPLYKLNHQKSEDFY